MKLGVVISANEPETVFNAFRLANFASHRGDEVRVFLLGLGVECDRISDERFDLANQLETFVGCGGTIMACGTCLGSRGSEGPGMCSLSTMNDLYQLVQESDRVVTF